MAYILTKLSGPAFDSSHSPGPAGTWRWSETGRQQRVTPHGKARFEGTGVLTTSAPDPDLIYVKCGECGRALTSTCQLLRLCVLFNALMQSLRFYAAHNFSIFLALLALTVHKGLTIVLCVCERERETLDSPCVDAWRGHRNPAPSAHVAQLWSPGFSCLCSSDQVSMGLHSWFIKEWKDGCFPPTQLYLKLKKKKSQSAFLFV